MRLATNKLNVAGSGIGVDPRIESPGPYSYSHSQTHRAWKRCLWSFYTDWGIWIDFHFEI